VPEEEKGVGYKTLRFIKKSDEGKSSKEEYYLRAV